MKIFNYIEYIGMIPYGTESISYYNIHYFEIIGEGGIYNTISKNIISYGRNLIQILDKFDICFIGDLR